MISMKSSFMATFDGALPMFVIFHVNVHKACLFCEEQAWPCCKNEPLSGSWGMDSKSPGSIQCETF